MRSQDATPFGASAAPGEPGPARLVAWPCLRTSGQKSRHASQNGPASRILRLNSQARERSAGRPPVPGGMELITLNLRTKSALFTVIATAVLGIALLLVYELVLVSDDPELTRQIGWNLLFIGLSAGILAAGAVLWVAQRIKLPLQRLAETMSAMAETGQLRSDFRAA